MEIAALYSDRDSDGLYIAVLRCSCTLHVPVGLLLEEDLPCPLHEAHRYFIPTLFLPPGDEGWLGPGEGI